MAKNVGFCGRRFFSGDGDIVFSMFDGLVTGIMADAVCVAAAEEEVTELRA